MLHTFHGTVKKDANVSLVRTLLLILVFINTIVLKVAFVDNENSRDSGDGVPVN